MTSAVQSIQSMHSKPVDLAQAYTPLQLDTLSRAGEVTSSASPAQSLSEREVTFSKLMATSGASDSSQVTQTSDKWYNVLPSSQTTDAQNVDQTSATGGTTSSQEIDEIFNSLDEDTQKSINDFLEIVKKETTASEFQTLKDGWVGNDGSEKVFGLIYYNFVSQVVEAGRQMTIRLEDDLKNL